jgi:cell division protein FtsI (penicillin-binding protein 3)
MPPSTENQSANLRLYWLGGILVLWSLAVGARLVQLQVLRYGEFEQRAQRQQQRSIEVSPRRGMIYDRNGRELAMSVNVDSVFAVPSEIPDPENTAGLLARVLRADKHEILARMKSSRAFCWVARKLDSDTAARIRALNLRGIYFQKEPKRFYPKRELAAQVLGYVGMDDEGLSGLEHEFDGELRGTPGKMLVSRDARGRYFGRIEHQPEAGQSLALTIDEKIQYISEREVERAMAETHAIAGTVIVENPHTGEVLALANRPNFNPNDARRITPAQLKNHAVTDVYEPGSTFKIVTIAAALEEKLTRPDELVDCQMGSIVVNGMRIHDHKPFGVLNVSQIIAKSSDVGAIKVGMRLGDDRFDRYIRAFGFGSQSRIELPAETRGLTKPVNRWSKVSIAAISMGQVIGISAVQLAGLISTIANDGVYVAPRIVASDVPGGRFGTDTRFQSVSLSLSAQRRVISSHTAAQMKQMLREVVLEGGTGPKAQLDGYTSAGKTGTAQKVEPGTHSYSKTKYVASFAGFAPFNNPAIVICVILDSAVGLHQGGQVAAPVFQRIAQQVLPYLNVPHDLPPSLRERILRASIRNDDLVEGSAERLGDAIAIPAGESALAQVEHQLKADDPVPAVMPASYKLGPRSWGKPSAARRIEEKPLVPQPPPPSPAAASAPAGSVVVDVDGGQVAPSFLGKPLRQVIELAQQDGIEIEAIGSGLAREQSPAPGTHLGAGQKVAVRFGR